MSPKAANDDNATNATGPRGRSICVVGHVTKDIVRIASRESRTQPGGSAYYAAIALSALGSEVTVITRVAPDDEALVLTEMRAAGVDVRVHPGTETTAFENIYENGDLFRRTQKVAGVAEPFTAEDLRDLEAPVLCLGPLTSHEMSADFVRAAGERASLVALEVQGYTRRLQEGTVKLTRSPEAAAVLAEADIVKLDVQEAQILTGLEGEAEAARAIGSLGPREVLITDAHRGSLVYAQGRIYRIPAFPPARSIDATGCGDTYLAGYLFHRLRSDDPEAAGRFAAALASLKLEDYGPARASLEDTYARAALEP